MTLMMNKDARLSNQLEIDFLFEYRVICILTSGNNKTTNMPRHDRGSGSVTGSGRGVRDTAPPSGPQKPEENLTSGELHHNVTSSELEGQALLQVQASVADILDEEIRRLTEEMETKAASANQVFNETLEELKGVMKTNMESVTMDQHTFLGYLFIGLVIFLAILAITLVGKNWTKACVLCTSGCRKCALGIDETRRETKLKKKEQEESRQPFLEAKQDLNVLREHLVFNEERRHEQQQQQFQQLRELQSTVDRLDRLQVRSVSGGTRPKEPLPKDKGHGSVVDVHSASGMTDEEKTSTGGKKSKI